MTREEAIKIFREWTDEGFSYDGGYAVEELDDDGKEALEMAIQALSQEPTVTSTDEPITMIYPTIVCDDAISRDAAIEAVKQAIYNHDSAIMRLTDLPSVTQKSGKWIDINGIYAECSNCNEEIYITGDFNYCPHCGAKMESEDKK